MPLSLKDPSPAPAATPDIGFIGAGRLGTALAWAMARCGARVAAAASRSENSARRLAAGIAGCRPMSTAQEVVDACGLVFVTVPDTAIQQTVAGLRWHDTVSAVHCSGATPVDALLAAKEQGASVGGFHPMQTFSEPEAAIRSLPGCTVTIEAEGRLGELLQQLATSMECRINRLPPGARARYHAAGAYASQILPVLLREASLIWQSFGKQEADAVAALLPLARGTLAAIESSGVAPAMPGPISRGDLATLKLHIEALAAVDLSIAALYCALSLRAVPLAVERGALTPDRARHFETLLREAERSLRDQTES